MDITISSLISDVKRHLSVIGKRLYDKQGNNLFANVTLSSAEDTAILTQYITSAAHDIEAALKQFISQADYGNTISMNISNTRGDSDFETRTNDMARAYITRSAVGEYLSMLHPDIAQKYHRDAQQRMETLIAYVFYKKPPIN